jgi:hypothetical protein
MRPLGLEPPQVILADLIDQNVLIEKHDGAGGLVLAGGA